jgi:hypothetical protein
VSDGGTLDLQEPLPHQVPVFDSPARFKVWRAGRRTGKSRGAWVAGMIGHGPGWYEFTPLHEGVAQGWDVVWLAPDYPQAKSIWLEDVKPRAENLDGVKLNNGEFTLELEDGGKLHVRSAEAIKSLRGLGARLKGIIIDEAAWMDLESHWRDVIRPILMDNEGWAIIVSTTNAALDGNAEHRTPSFFNLLCQEIADGKRDPEEWVEFYGTAQDNPLISPKEFQSLIREYTEDSPSLAQEVYAKLLVAGTGVAFPEWRKDHHEVSYDPPPGWRWFGGVDWGYAQPCAVVILAAGPDRDLLARTELYVRQKTPYEVGYLVGQKAKQFPQLEFLAGDSAMWAVTDGSPSVAEEFQRGLTAATAPATIPLISVSKGPGSRAARKQLLHEQLRYQKLEDGTISKYAGAALRVHRECANLIRTLPALPIDPKNSEDVDTKAEDHAYDALTYALMSRAPRPDQEQLGRVPDDVHPGIDRKRRKRKPRWQEEPDQEAVRLEQLGQGHFTTGIRYGGQARPVEDSEL